MLLALMFRLLSSKEQLLSGMEAMIDFFCRTLQMKHIIKEEVHPEVIMGLYSAAKHICDNNVLKYNIIPYLFFYFLVWIINVSSPASSTNDRPSPL